MSGFGGTHPGMFPWVGTAQSQQTTPGTGRKILLPVFNPRFLPPLQLFAPFELIRYNVEEDEPVRNEQGLCIPVKPGKG